MFPPPLGTRAGSFHIGAEILVEQRDTPMRRDPILAAWGIGLLLAALVYVVGPDRFLFRVLDTLHVLGWRIAELVDDLSIVALDLIRALAIGLYATFVVLAVAVSRRGGPSRGALVVVSLLFLALAGGTGVPNTRWTAALVLCAVGAAVMTGRLRQPQPVGLAAR